jgi:FtsZ-binding cell division protein ZapB
MELLREDDPDSLASLEERIRKAVELVAALRKENAGLADKLRATQTEKDSTVAALTHELDTLRAERQQVRARIEKLLGQMDALGAG